MRQSWDNSPMGRQNEASTIRFDHFRVFTFGSEQELISVFGSMKAAKDAWNTTKSEFLKRWDLWGMPSAWWHFEPGVPEDIRSGPHAIISESDAREWERIEMARRRYLISLGIDPAPQRKYAPFGSD